MPAIIHVYALGNNGGHTHANACCANAPIPIFTARIYCVQPCFCVTACLRANGYWRGAAGVLPNCYSGAGGVLRVRW
eukprot:11217898-Lingulodinium_polyedra.AAC.1